MEAKIRVMARQSWKKQGSVGTVLQGFLSILATCFYCCSVLLSGWLRDTDLSGFSRSEAVSLAALSFRALTDVNLLASL